MKRMAVTHYIDLGHTALPGTDVTKRFVLTQDLCINSVNEASLGLRGLKS